MSHPRHDAWSEGRFGCDLRSFFAFLDPPLPPPPPVPLILHPLVASRFFSGTAPDVNVGGGDVEVDVGGQPAGIFAAVSAPVVDVRGPSIDAGTEGSVPSVAGAKAPSLAGEVPTGMVDVVGKGCLYMTNAGVAAFHGVPPVPAYLGRWSIQPCALVIDRENEE